MFDIICLDESIKIKSPKAQQTKAVKKLPAKYRIALSGYPIANRIIDIWSQVDWVQPGYLGTFWSFQDTYTVRDSFQSIVSYKNIDELKKKLDPLYIRRLKKDVLDLPPKIYQTKYIELSPKEWKAYKDMKDDMYIQIKNMKEEEIIAKAPTILIQLLRLSQLTNGFMTDKNLGGIPHWFGESSKLKVLDDIVDETLASGNKIVIWSRWVPCIAALYGRYKKYNAVYLSGSVKSEDRIKAINDFQEGNAKIFCGQMQSGGMGITLHAANIEVFLDKAFVSPSTIFQATERVYRIGQTKKVVIISLLAKNTVDEKWDILIKEKQSMAEELLRDNEIKMNKEHILGILK